MSDDDVVIRAYDRKDITITLGPCYREATREELIAELKSRDGVYYHEEVEDCFRNMQYQKGYTYITIPKQDKGDD